MQGGASVYPNCKPFIVDGLCGHIGVYIFHELAPSPQLDMEFQLTSKNLVNGNDFVYTKFGLRAAQKHREFKAFFAVVDPILATLNRATHPNWKVGKFFKHAICISKEFWYIGRRMSKLLGVKVNIQIFFGSRTKMKRMVFNVMQCVLMATHIIFIFVTSQHLSFSGYEHVTIAR